MKKIMGNTLIKILAALLCTALLVGMVWYGLWGVLVRVETPENIAKSTLRMAMYNPTQGVHWCEDMLREVLDSPEQDWSQLDDYFRNRYDPSRTNFRFEMVDSKEGTILLSTYNGEHQLEKYSYWEQHFVGTEEQRDLILGYESGYYYYADESDEVTPITPTPMPTPTPAPMPVLDTSVVLDMNTVITVDGTRMYPISPDAGLPDEFAYINDYNKIFDADFSYLTTLDEYRAENDIQDDTPATDPLVTPTPMPTEEASADNAPLTREEYLALREEVYRSVVVNGYVVQSDAAVTDEEGNPITAPRFAVEDQYSEIYNYMLVQCTANGEELDLAVGFGVMAALLLLFLILSAGHRATEEGDQIVLRPIDRMPWDLWLCFVAAGALLAFGGVYLCAMTLEPALNESIRLVDLVLKGFLLVGSLTVAFCIWMFMSFSARVKAKGWLRNCLCLKLFLWCRKWCKKILTWCFKVLKRFFGALSHGIKGIPLIWKAAGVLGVLFIVEFIYIVSNIYDNWAGVGVLWNVVKLLVCIIICLMLKQLQQGARTIADGDLDHRIDTKHLYGEFKTHAECLNNIGEGLSRSVDDKLRSERMKTELITNVSHDLKTPLTSIVNYVDLLKKEELTGTAAEYVEVLDRQSARLKKLTEDLVEASKASTGALQVNLEWVSLTELLEQARGEYALRLEASGLQTVVHQPEQEVEVRADGRYVWRILDNLLSNVCKYAMPNTRVYLDLRTEGDRAILSVKNISRDCLNISADELMERFVRGDSSRTTEGSGLGLSIALSLAKLMGGDLQLTVDGDLFKADVILPLAK